MKDVEQILSTLGLRLKEKIEKENIADPLLVGIHTGGAWVAQRLHQALTIAAPLGTLNISFYRDDFTRIGMHPQVHPSNLPISVENRNVIVVDDVLYTGRTIRAALNEIFDYGRPKRVILAVLIERGGRELPICAEVFGEHIDLAATQQIKLTGPQPLSLTIVNQA